MKRKYTNNNIPANSLDVTKVSFGDFETDKYDNKRIPIKYDYGSGEPEDLILITEKVFSFGVSEKRMRREDGVPQPLTGYSLPLRLYTRDGATPEDRKTVEGLEALADLCKEHLYGIRKAIKKPRLTKEELHTIFSALYWKFDDDGEKVEPDAGPTLYASLLTIKEDVEKFQIRTKFFNDSTSELIDPMTLIGQRFNCVAAIKIESIFSGAKHSIQVKVLQVRVSLIESNFAPQCMIPSFSGNVISLVNTKTSDIKKQVEPPKDTDEDDEDWIPN